MRKMPKKGIVSSFQMLKEVKREKQEKKEPVVDFFCFRERRTSFSLEFREIRPLKVIGARRKAALRRETSAWAPDLRSFDKL